MKSIREPDGMNYSDEEIMAIADDAVRTELRILRQKICELERPQSDPIYSTVSFRSGWKFAIFEIVRALDEILREDGE